MRGDGGPKEDKDSIQGYWKVIAAENNGVELPRDTIVRLRLVVTGERITLMDGATTEFEATYKLDPGHTPKRIDLTDAKTPRTVKAIYRLSGDDLKIVYDEGATAGQYPTDFVSEGSQSPNDRLLTLKRTTKDKLAKP